MKDSERNIVSALYYAVNPILHDADDWNKNVKILFSFNLSSELQTLFQYFLRLTILTGVLTHGFTFYVCFCNWQQLLYESFMTVYWWCVTKILLLSSKKEIGDNWTNAAGDVYSIQASQLGQPYYWKDGNVNGSIMDWAPVPGKP